MDFEKRTWLLVGGASVLAFVLGWSLKPKETELVEVQPTKSARSEVVVTNARSSRGVDVSGWMRRLESEEAGTVVEKVEDDELEPLAEELLAGMWGTIGSDERKQFRALVAEWMKRDPEACLAWARGQQDRGLREAGLLAIVDSLGDSDPIQAIKIYTEIDRITLKQLSDVNGRKWTEALSEIAQDGPEAIAEILDNLPLVPTVGEAGFADELLIDFLPPDGFDYERLFQLVPDLGHTDAPKRHLDVEVLMFWAEKDFEGAWNHVESQIADGNVMKWGGTLREAEKIYGEGAGIEMGLEVIRGAPEDMQGPLLDSSWHSNEILDAIPDMNERLELLARAHDLPEPSKPFGSERWSDYAEHLGMTSQELQETWEALREEGADASTSGR